MTTFKELGLNSFLCEKLASIGIRSPTGIQRQAIPEVLKLKRDVFACSETGSGKSLAYILPILQTLMLDPRPYFALIITPTRELSYQINEIIKILTRSKSTSFIKSMLVIGGNKFEEDDDQGLWIGKPNIVVATPGRLLYCLEKRNYLDTCGQMSTLKFDMLVLDEADQLITPSFAIQLKGLIDWIDANKGKRKRQTLVFSATLTPSLEKLKESIQSKDMHNKPLEINLLTSIENIKQELATNPHLDQRYVICPEYVKTVYLVECLLDIQFKQLIVFCDSKKKAKLIFKVITALGFDSKEFNLHPVLLTADLKQKLRFAALEKFKSLKSRILVTTDLASRGLDLPLVDLVINYNCPKEEVTYIHRVGRTCRRPDIFKNQSDGTAADADKPLSNTVSLAGKKDPRFQGKSITFISQYDLKLLQNIEESIQIKLQKEDKLDEENVPKILRKVVLAIKEAELQIEQEEAEKQEAMMQPSKKIKL